MKRNFITRTITGVLFVAVLVLCTLWNALSFGVLFSLVSLLAIGEFCHIINKKGDIHINRNICVLGGLYLYLSFFYVGIFPDSTFIFIPYLVILLHMFISELYLKRTNPINNWTYSFFTQIYIALPIALLNVLAFHTVGDTGASEFNPILPLSIFIFSWVNDSGAYCTGVMWGKHRLFERISPKKSWEGSIGGGVLTILSSFVMFYFFPFLTLIQWIGLGLVVIVFGTYGDLAESLIKRNLGIKDSGNVLPGHGGLLDRFDSALFAIPAAVVYLYLIKL